MTPGKKFNYKHYLRRAHRYLGVFIGIQFILWTIGGLYFSWTNLSEIHGDHLRAPSTVNISLPAGSIAPDDALARIRDRSSESRIEKVYFVELFGENFYAVETVYEAGRSTALLNVQTGEFRDPVSSDEAARIARKAAANVGEPIEVLYLTADNVDKHHEYREKPLPAWAVNFENNVTVYLSAETGQVGAIRTDKWRAFDFLWMLHTMDFQGRDNFNNYLLRAFSILGVVTVLSGFALFFVSSRMLRRLSSKRR